MQEFVSLTIVQRSELWLFELYKGNWRKHLNKLICICSSYHSGFPPEAPSERGGNMVRPYTLMKIAAKALILWTIATWQMWWALQNFFSSEGEAKTEQEMNRPHHPAMKWGWNSEAKQAQTFRTYRHSSWLFWSVHVLFDYDLSSAKNTTTACVGYAPVLTAMSHLTA